MREQSKGNHVRIPGRLEPGEPLWLASHAPPDSPLFAGASSARSFRLGGIGARGDAVKYVTEDIPDDALVEIDFAR